MEQLQNLEAKGNGDLEEGGEPQILYMTSAHTSG